MMEPWYRWSAIYFGGYYYKEDFRRGLMTKARKGKRGNMTYKPTRGQFGINESTTLHITLYPDVESERLQGKRQHIIILSPVSHFT